MLYSLLSPENRCANVVVWDGQSDWQPPDGYIVVEGGLNVGDYYDFDAETSSWLQRQPPLPTPEQLAQSCDYYGFWDALLISSVYQTIRTQATQSLEVNTCCTEFIAAISDAKAGRVNKDALQACIWLLMAALTLTAEETEELERVLAAGGLNAVYRLTPA